MSLVEEFKDLIGEVNGQSEYFSRNTSLYEINEGQILPYIEKALAEQFSGNTYKQMTHRIPPINILKRVVDKLSRIYQPGPVRSVSSDDLKDSELLKYYEKSFKINNKMNCLNEYFNLFKNSLLYIAVIDGKPRIRPIPSDRFYVFGKNELDPTKPTHVITFQGNAITKDRFGQIQKNNIYYLYTDTEFLIVEGDKTIRRDLMEKLGNADGVNPYGRLPFVYVNRSLNEIIPLPDSDMKAMSLIIPQNLTDLNAGVMFQVFSIFYGINLNSEGLIYSPNAFWNFKVDPGVESKSEIGVLQPNIDVDKALALIQAQLSLWLQTLGIRPGSVGQVTADNFSSGISKIIDEMDTYENRLKQIDYFKSAEDDLWDFVINYGHPYWVASGQIEQSLLWSSGAEIIVNFADPIPLQNKSEILKDKVIELEKNLTTRKRVIQELNPQMSENEIELLLREIDEDKNKDRTFVLSLDKQPMEDMDQEVENDMAESTL